jgi:hypothetical protein
MLQIARTVIHSASLTLALIAAPALNSQQSVQPAAHVPAQIVSAHKVFISNAGADATAQAAFTRAGDPEEAYNGFYSAMQSWGRYELVPTPAEADIVFEIRFTAAVHFNGSLPIYEPEFELSILDAKTHFVLWNTIAPVDGAFRKATWIKNFDRGLDALMDNLKKLSARP